MRYHALACDYDGTIAWDGTVSASTLHALEEIRKSGRKLLLVTGRELPDLLRTFPDLEIFDQVVVENGALLYQPSTREERVLASAPPPEFAAELRRRGVDRISEGRVIVATWTPFETVALQVIKEMGLELQVIFNKGAVMILPSGVNKATGLAVALEELGLSAHNVVGVGDAENDHAFLSTCECAVAVANALEGLKDRVDWVTTEGHGNGVVELIDRMMSSDLSDLETKLRQRFLLGHRADGSRAEMRPYGTNVLISGTSGAGKSTLATAFIESLVEQSYQFLVIDPEGDYSTLEKAVVLGTEQTPPTVDAIMELVSKPRENGVVNLVGLPLKERPGFFAALLPRLTELRARTGRPHWLLVDEAHHVLPSSWASVGLTASQRMFGLMMITLEANRVSPDILSAVDLVISIGEHPDGMLQIFSDTVGVEAPRPYAGLRQGEALAWYWRSAEGPFGIHTVQPKQERRRHLRKYAEGDLGPDLSFYFKGPDGKLNLRAQNLAVFLQLAEGVDDETWLFHLAHGDISSWFRDVIKDPELAGQVEPLRKKTEAAATRQQIRDLVEKKYILAV